MWADAMAQIGAAGDRLVAAMRERGETVDADVYVSLLGALMDTYLNRVSGEADIPTFVPCCGYYQHLGSPEPRHRVPPRAGRRRRHVSADR